MLRFTQHDIHKGSRTSPREFDSHRGFPSLHKTMDVQIAEIAQVLLFDRGGRLLIYLRDDNPKIPFPNHWDLFGGHLEAGETPEQALVRELREELGITLKDWQFFRRFDCAVGDAYPNLKHIYWAVFSEEPGELTLYEGQRLRSITKAERKTIKFANILGNIVDEFVGAGLWPEAVDNF